MNRRRFTAAGMALAAVGMRPMIGVAEDMPEFHVPAEEDRHQRTFMQWPISRQVYGDPAFMDATQRVIAEIANTISDFEPVTMLTAKKNHAAARRRLSDAVELWDIPTEDLWCRDSGPLFAVDGKGGLAISHIRFNGWGRRQVHTRDGRIAERVAERLGLPLRPTGLVGEPGGVEQDGHGLLMAHESSWVNENRNPGQSRDDVEERLLAAYGAERMIWANGLRDWDITDYHIDGLARFTGPGRVLMNMPDRPDQRDPFHRAARATQEVLTEAGLEIEVIPSPERRRVSSIDFVDSYVNYYVCNGAVIAAQFGDPDTDATAVDALRRHYPGREVIALNIDPLGEVGGGIHCATQQMPLV